MTTAGMVMKTDLVTVEVDTSLIEAIQLLINHKISGLPVVNSSGELIGILTEKDVMPLLFEEKGRFSSVGDLMVREVRTFQVDDPLAQICDCLMSNPFRRVPILEGRRIVGLISRADLMGEILEAAAGNSG